MLNVYRELADIRERTPTNFNWMLKRRAQDLAVTPDSLEKVVHDYDVARRNVFVSVYQVYDLGTRYNDEDGTTGEISRLIEFKEAQNLPSVQLLADYLWPRTYCTHEYDCCAHWYCHWPEVIQISPFCFKVVQGTYQNV